MQYVRHRISNLPNTQHTFNIRKKMSLFDSLLNDVMRFGRSIAVHFALLICGQNGNLHSKITSWSLTIIRYAYLTAADKKLNQP